MARDSIVELTGSVVELRKNKDGIIKFPHQTNDRIIHPLDDNMATNDYLRTSSLDIYEGVNWRREYQRRLYRDWLIGEGKRSELGHELNYSTGSLIKNETSRPPSWTQVDAGFNHAYVISTLSSSKHEETHYNLYKSASIALESTAVSATGSVYYTKKPREYFKAIYSLTASADMIATAAHNADTMHAQLGLQFSASFGKVATFTLNVPDRGRIIDIRVWVEFMHNSGTDYADGDDAWLYDNTRYPLGSFVLALRSPDPSLGSFFSFPIYNDARIKPHVDRLSEYVPLTYQDGNTTEDPPEMSTIFRRSFLLWVGRSGSDGEADTFQTNMSSWQKDRHMRTIFWDGSTQRNPCTLDPFYTGDNATLANFNWRISGRFGSPNGSETDDVTGTGFGNDWPWISDVDDWYVQEGAADEVTDPVRHSGSGSPPTGWLTGGGGVAADNEYPTTGSNFGPEDIRAYLPLLDTIEEKQKTFNGSLKVRPEIRGRRPGLRGTQMQGDWQLMAVTTPIVKQEGIAIYDSAAVYAWFRQFRLEITYESDVQYYSDASVRFHRYKHNSHGHFKNGELLATRLSGATPQIAAGGDFNRDARMFVVDLRGLGVYNNQENEVYYIQERPYGMTAGIIEDTGSLNSGEFAVFSRITGALSDRLSGSDHAHARYLFLNNEFGTPLIPEITSGSGEPVELQFFLKSDVAASKELISNIFSQKPIVEPSVTLKSLLSKKQGMTSLSRDIALQKTSGSV